MPKRKSKKINQIHYTVGNISDTQGCLRVIKDLPNHFTQKSQKEITSCLHQKNFIVAKDKNQIIGFCCIKGGRSSVQEISWLAVHPDYQRKKIGKRLVERVLKKMKRTKAHFALVKTLGSTSGRNSYAQARKFYEQMGFINIITIDPYPGWDAGNPCNIYIKHIR